MLRWKGITMDSRVTQLENQLLHIQTNQGTLDQKLGQVEQTVAQVQSSQATVEHSLIHMLNNRVSISPLPWIERCQNKWTESKPFFPKEGDMNDSQQPSLIMDLVAVTADR